MGKTTRSRRSLLLLAPAVFFALFFAYPLIQILAESFKRSEGGLVEFLVVLRDPMLRKVAMFTFWQAAISTLITILVALPGANLMARHSFGSKRLLRALITVPFVLPTVVVATAFWGLTGSGSWLEQSFGWSLGRGIWPILLAHVFFNYSVVVRIVGSYWSQLDPAMEEAAETLGASWFRKFIWVTLPRLLPALGAAGSLVFLFTFTSFGIVLLLGDITSSTLEVEIHRQILFLFDLPTAAVLALLQMAFVVVILAVQSSLESRLVKAHSSPVLRNLTRPRRSKLFWNVAFMLVGVVTPLAVLVERSLSTGDGYGLRYYRALGKSRRGTTLFISPLEAVRNSLWIATQATAIALALGFLVAAGLVGLRSRTKVWASALMLVPLGTSAVTLGFGMLIAFDESPFNFRSQSWLVPVAQALIASPFVVRVMLPMWTSIRSNLADAAAVLGASPWMTFLHVELPLLLRGIVVATGFAFAVSLGEFGATVFLARSSEPTVPVAIFRFLSRPGELNFGQAMALSTILMLLVIASVLVIERFSSEEMSDL